MKSCFKIYDKIGQIITLTTLAFVFAVLPGQSNHKALAQPDQSVMFIENVGQFEASTRFQTYNSPVPLSLTEDALWFTIIEPLADDPNDRGDFQNTLERQSDLNTSAISGQGVNLKLSFVNANPHPDLEPFNPLNTRVSYFTGSNLTNRRVNVPVWGGVRYLDLYPGVDLEITGQNGQLAQRLVLHNRAEATTSATPQLETQSAVTSLEDIKLQVEGAESLALADNGRLSLTTAVGEFTLPLLQVEQANAPAAANLTPGIEGNIVTHPFSFAPLLAGASAQIAGASDLIYSTFLGGSGEAENGWAIAVDAAGNAYVGGETSSTDFPTTPGAFNTSPDGHNAFVVKLNAAGSELVYATFLEGGRVSGIAVDDAGNAYVMADNSVVKLNSTGTDLIYATTLDAQGRAIAVDESGNAYVTGNTASATFPATPGAFQTSFQGGGWFGLDGFVAKLNAAGELSYATYLGGSDDDNGEGIAVDAEGNAYVTGSTESSDFPTTPGAFDTNSGSNFVVKLNPAGSALSYATFLGGGSDHTYGIAVDQSGSAYVIGYTTNSNFPTTPGAFQTTYHPGIKVTYDGDAFVTKFNAAGEGLVYSTFLGGSDHDVGFAIAVDQSGNAYATGTAYSPDFPTTPDSFQPSRSGYPDIFVSKLNAAGSDLAYGTYLGGDWGDAGYAIAVDEAGNAYVTGYTSAPNFPVTADAFDTNLAGDDDAFVAKLAAGSSGPEPTPTPIPIPVHNCAPTTLGAVTVGNTPRGIALDVAKQRVYVANFGSNSVSVIDSSTNTVIETITGVTSANGIAYDGLHNMLWVTNTNTDQVTPIEVNQDATSFTVLPPVDVGDGPWGVVFDPIYGYLYVANSLGNSVSVVNVSSRTVEVTLDKNFSQPFHMAATPVTGKVYVANFGNNTVTVLKGTSVSSVVPLWDSAQPYGIAVDETRNLVYVATVATNRIVAIGTLNGVPDQFLGWAAFYRGYNRQRPLPLRAIAVNPDIGPSYDGGHVWATTSTVDGSELNQALFIPKGWSSYFHVPLPQNVADNPSDGLAVDRVNDRVYVSSGANPGTVTVIGDHANQCSGVFPASVSNDFDLDFFSREALARGDATGDGLVDIFDLTFIATRYDSADYTADVNGDGLVDIFDLTLVASRYGQAVSTGE